MYLDGSQTYCTVTSVTWPILRKCYRLCQEHEVFVTGVIKNRGAAGGSHPVLQCKQSPRIYDPLCNLDVLQKIFGINSQCVNLVLIY